jgi:hypothetical protein
MAIDKSTVYFTAQPTRNKGKLVIDFRHAQTGLVLDLAEATLLQDLPKELSLCSHPGLPGRAAWVWSNDDILQMSMALRRAGYASSKKELANPRPVPPKPVPEAPKAGDGPFRILAPGIVMDMSGIMPRNEPRDPYDVEEVVFNSKELNGRVVVNFAETGPDGHENWLERIDRELLDDPLWASIGQILEISGHRFLSKYDQSETIRRLESLGLTKNEDIFMWFDPRDLEFGVSTKTGELVDEPGHIIFIIPKDENSPHYDDLRDDHLPEVPAYFVDNMMENTWLLSPEMQRDAVIKDMTARGYVYNSDLDDCYGG